MDQFSSSDDTGNLYRRRRSLRIFGIRIGSRRKLLYPSLSLLFSLFVNYLFLWPVNHFWALMLVALSVSGVMLQDSNRRRAAPVAGSSFVAAGLLYLVLGPAESPDSAAHRYLLPGKEATPANACMAKTGGKLAPGTKRVLVGDNAILLHPGTNVVALTVGICRSVAIYQDAEGVILNADDFDSYGQVLFRIYNNQLRLIDGRPAWEERSRDHDAVTIFGGGGDEMMRAAYLNQDTLRLSGVFACKGHAPVTITNDAPVPGAPQAACLDGTGVTAR